MVNGKKFVVFVSDLISKSDISLFERPTQDAMMKRFMTVWNELNHQKSKVPLLFKSFLNWFFIGTQFFASSIGILCQLR